jgi:hypothetical protein
MASQGSCGSASIRCRVMPESDRKDAFVPGQSLVVLGCSWRAGTMRFPLSAFPCAFAPHPPNPLLPQGEKGESGVLMAGNGRWHAGASPKNLPPQARKGVPPSLLARAGGLRYGEARGERREARGERGAVGVRVTRRRASPWIAEGLWSLNK